MTVSRRDWLDRLAQTVRRVYESIPWRTGAHGSLTGNSRRGRALNYTVRRTLCLRAMAGTNSFGTGYTTRAGNGDCSRIRPRQGQRAFTSCQRSREEHQPLQRRTRTPAIIPYSRVPPSAAKLARVLAKISALFGMKRLDEQGKSGTHSLSWPTLGACLGWDL